MKSSSPLFSVCIAFFSFSLLAGIVSGCGSGGGSTNAGSIGPGSNADFGISVSSSNLTVGGGSSATVSVTLITYGGWSSPVTLSFPNLPSGVTVTPSNPQVTPPSSLQLTFSASTSVQPNQTSITIVGTGTGSLSRNTTLQLTVNSAPRPLPRTHYIRTDALTQYGFMVNLGWSVFDSNTHRYFVCDPFGNAITAIDSVSQKKIATIYVPSARSLDESPDHSTLWVGTDIGDVYTVDPVGLTVKQRFPYSQIGGTGFRAIAARATANGQIVLLGGVPAAFGSASGYSTIATWDPIANTFSHLIDLAPIMSPPSDCNNVITLTPSGDRSLVMLGGKYNSVCAFDPVSGQLSILHGSTGLGSITAAAPDGNSFLYVNDNKDGIVVLNLKTLTQASTIPIGSGPNHISGMIVSADSKNVYITDSQDTLFAYDIASGKQLGWLPGLFIPALATGLVRGSPNGPNLGAIDDTGLIAGPMEEGVGFLDTSAIIPGAPGTIFLNAYVSPATGPAAGGTPVQWTTSQDVRVSGIFFGPNRATNASEGQAYFYATTPAGVPGPADVFALMQDGSELILPEAFSYGPTLLQAAPNASSSEGGGMGILYGYGFGTISGNTSTNNAQITIGGKSAPVTGYARIVYATDFPPFPLQAISYTIPPGLAGESSDITVTTPSGSTTLAGGMRFLPQAQTFQLPNAQLAQGVYDPRRQKYYFTDASSIQVLSRSANGQWLSPITVPMPPAGKAHRLWGISLSPDGSKLAVSDTAASMIYVLDPDAPASVQSISVPGPYSQGRLVANPTTSIHPAGLAISNNGILYYAAFCDESTYDGLFKLDTRTGQVTDYGAYGSSSNQVRVVLSSDGKRLYYNAQGVYYAVDTATGAVRNPVYQDICCNSAGDITLSGDGTNLAISG